ncbi:MAG: HesA/MoeB/ThiF family protein [Arachnia sp.]
MTIWPGPLVEPVATLAPHEVQRYARTISLAGVGTEGQRRLKSARVCVVGAGGLGGPVLQYLVGAGVGHVTVVDDDVVEVRNLQRQTLYGHGSVGHGKADAAVTRLRDLNDLISISAVSRRVTAETAADIFAGHDLVVDAVDNLPTRLVTADACQALDLPFVWGAVQSVNGQVSVFWERLGLGLRDLFPRPPAEMPKLDDVGVLGPMTGWVGAVMATECLKVIMGIGEPLVGRVMYIDTLGARVSELPLKGRGPQ